MPIVSICRRAAVTAVVFVLFAGVRTAGAQPDVWTFKDLPYSWAHESTHLGDEYVIIAQRPRPDRPRFERVNPSFEYLEYGVSYERMFGDAMLTLRHGGIRLHGDDGYYTNHLLGSDEPTLTPSEKNFEPSFGLEWRGWKKGSRDAFVSVDMRHKLAYRFHRAPGERQPSSGRSAWPSAAPCPNGPSASRSRTTSSTSTEA